jgi:hypothetical protein
MCGSWRDRTAGPAIVVYLTDKRPAIEKWPTPDWSTVTAKWRVGQVAGDPKKRPRPDHSPLGDYTLSMAVKSRRWPARPISLHLVRYDGRCVNVARFGFQSRIPTWISSSCIRLCQLRTGNRSDFRDCRWRCSFMTQRRPSTYFFVEMDVAKCPFGIRSWPGTRAWPSRSAEAVQGAS